MRAATLAQAVPTASFVPCVASVPPGWSIDDFAVKAKSAAVRLRSDRSDAPVEVRFERTCSTGDATALPPEEDGVRTLLLVRTISPLYAGTLFEVFPGGCVTYEFQFERGPHIALVDEMKAAIELLPRHEIRRRIERDLGVDIG